MYQIINQIVHCKPI